jgi:hypothetical protein
MTQAVGLNELVLVMPADFRSYAGRFLPLARACQSTHERAPMAVPSVPAREIRHRAAVVGAVAVHSVLLTALFGGVQHLPFPARAAAVVEVNLVPFVPPVQSRLES